MIYFTGQEWTHKHEFDWCVLALWNFGSSTKNIQENKNPERLKDCINK